MVSAATDNDDADVVYEHTELLRARAVAKLLSVRPRTVHLWVNSGKMPRPVALSHRVHFWRRREIEDWVDSGCPRCDEWVWGTA